MNVKVKSIFRMGNSLHKQGDIIDVDEVKAKSLQYNGYVVIVGSESKVPDNKALQSPDINKMVETPQKKKGRVKK
jgi:hypothetical protein